MLQGRQDIGKLDLRITFQSKVVGTNESNEDEEEGWADIATNPTVWASKDDKTGTEQYAADKLTGFQGHVFRIRYRNDINIMMRILCQGLAHNIVSIVEVGRRRFLEILAETGEQYVTLE